VRFPKKKVSARATALALALGVTAVLVTALPASASAIPIVSAVSPTSGVRGTPVTITGTGFNNSGSDNVTGVTINGAAASFVFVNTTTLTATVPCAATTGLGNVLVTNATGTSMNNGTSDDFTVTASGAPTVTSFSPNAGTAGVTSVSIIGTNFCGATSVRFNATTQSILTINSPTQITATVPAGATTGKVSVTTLAGTGTSVADFTVGPPLITSFSPTIGLAGTTVVINGSNFLNASSVKFNGLAATYTVNSSTQITTTVPTGATTGPISVTNALATATGGTFTVGVPAHARSVTFSYRGKRASGNVSVSDGFSACFAFVPVYIEQLRNGGWKLLDTTATNGSGAYSTWVPDKIGKFRAEVKKLSLEGGSICKADASPTRLHS
jgi:hypothetical protein